MFGDDTVFGRMTRAGGAMVAAHARAGQQRAPPAGMALMGLAALCRDRADDALSLIELAQVRADRTPSTRRGARGNVWSSSRPPQSSTAARTAVHEFDANHRDLLDISPV